MKQSAGKQEDETVSAEKEASEKVPLQRWLLTKDFTEQREQTQIRVNPRRQKEKVWSSETWILRSFIKPLWPEWNGKWAKVRESMGPCWTQPCRSPKCLTAADQRPLFVTLWFLERPLCLETRAKAEDAISVCETLYIPNPAAILLVLTLTGRKREQSSCWPRAWPI